MLRNGEVPEGRTEAAIVQKATHGARHGTVEPLPGATDLLDGDGLHNHHTV